VCKHKKVNKERKKVYKSFLKEEVIFYVHQGCIYLLFYCFFVEIIILFFSGFLDTKKVRYFFVTM